MEKDQPTNVTSIYARGEKLAALMIFFGGLISLWYANKIENINTVNAIRMEIQLLRSDKEKSDIFFDDRLAALEKALPSEQNGREKVKNYNEALLPEQLNIRKYGRRN